MNKRTGAFGGSAVQHDPQELLMFLLEILVDEMNPYRNLPSVQQLSDAQEAAERELEDGASAEQAWLGSKRADGSIIFRYLTAQITQIIECNKCGLKSRRHELMTQLPANFDNDASPPCKLRDLIAAGYGPDSKQTIDDFRCSRCCGEKETVTANRTDYISAMPDYLIVQIVRFRVEGTITSKVRYPVQFDEAKDNRNFLDLTDCFLPMKGQTMKDMIPQQNGNCKYRPISVVVHSGSDIGGGHFYTIAKQVDQETNARKWHKYNDKEPVKVINYQETQKNDSYLVVFQKVED